MHMHVLQPRPSQLSNAGMFLGETGPQSQGWESQSSSQYDTITLRCPRYETIRIGCPQYGTITIRCPQYNTVTIQYNHDTIMLVTRYSNYSLDTHKTIHLQYSRTYLYLPYRRLPLPGFWWLDNAQDGPCSRRSPW